MRSFAFAAAFVALGVTTAPAQNTEYVIKLAGPVKGDKVRTVVAELVECKTKLLLAGKDEVRTSYTSKELEYEDDILEGPAGARLPRRLKRDYKVARTGNGPDAKSLNIEALLIQGKSVEIINIGPSYEFRIAKGYLTEKSDKTSFDLLKAEFATGRTDLRDYMLPKGPVRVGEKWAFKPGSPNVKKVADVFGSNSSLQISDISAIMEGELAKGAKRKKDDKDAPLTGTIRMTFTAQVSSFGPRESGFVVQNGTLTVEVTGTGCIDGRSPNGTTITVMKLDVKGTIDGIKTEVQVTATEDRKTELLPPPPKK